MAGRETSPEGVLDVHGWSIEEFGLPLNLMLSVTAPLVVGDARAALEQRVHYQSAGPLPKEVPPR